MSSSPAIQPSEPLSESRKAALISLLTDEDTAVYHTVRDKILSCGQPAIGWLRPHTLSGDATLRRRAQEIIQHLARQQTDGQFLAFCLSQGEELDLERGCWLLALTQYPDINVEAYQALLDSQAAELRERLDLRAEADQLLPVFHDYLFQGLGFRGNEQNYYDPENSYLNRVLDRRTGNPVNLCLVYLLLARRLRLPVAGIALPGHFLCRFQTSSEEYYIDVFDRGKFWTKADCVQYLLRGKHSLAEDHLAPVSPRRMLLRVCGNLHQIYQQLELNEEATRFQRYLIALSRQGEGGTPARRPFNLT